MECETRCFWAAMTPVLYILAIYVADWKGKDRNDSTSIFKRFAGVSVACLVIAAIAHHYDTSDQFMSKMGFRRDKLIESAALPLLLTVILFLGPLMLSYFDGTLHDQIVNFSIPSLLNDSVWLRNQVIAPVTEEFAFRSCTLCLLAPCLTDSQLIFIAPLFFSLAHYHHFLELKRKGNSFFHCVLITTFQAGYTYAFGVYAAFLFIRTGHIIGPILVHSFCNHMGFPSFGDIFTFEGKTVPILLVSFVIGLVAWLCLLIPLTNPSLYH